MNMRELLLKNQLYASCRDDKILDLASKTAYKLFLSFFPLMIFMLSIVSGIDTKLLNLAMPPFILDILLELSESQTSKVVDVISISIFLVALYRIYKEFKKNILDILDGEKIKKSAKYIIPTMWISATLLFDIYMQSFANLAAIYGQIGLIMGIAIWLYAISFSIYFGIELSLVLPENLPNPLFNIPEPPPESN